MLPGTDNLSGEAMNPIQTCELPQAALLNKYRADGAYMDCYFVDVARVVSCAEYIEAFYTTPLFKVERLILALLAFRPSSDVQARQLASGADNDFAAWSVEGRSSHQLLLCDFLGRTRSWLMTGAAGNGDSSHTRLYFGSAVIPKKVDTTSGRKDFGFAFHALMNFHELYSRALLRSAAWRLKHPRSSQ